MYTMNAKEVHDMDQYVTGAMIKALREKKHLTQVELAELLNISDKTVSKWENGKGYPDITLLEPIAAAFHISIVELLDGNAVMNTNVSANMLRSKFYVCPVCGNAMHSMGETFISCHGIVLPPLEAEPVDEVHDISIDIVEDEYFVTVDHEMTKNHYISFIAAVSSDRLQVVKLYPEGNGQARFKRNSVKTIFFYCNQDGLYKKNFTPRKQTGLY